MSLSKRYHVGLSTLIVIIAALVLSAKADNISAAQTVSTVEQLQQKLADVKAGDVIVLKDGEYTAAQPISIQNKKAPSGSRLLSKRRIRGRLFLQVNYGFR